MHRAAGIRIRRADACDAYPITTLVKRAYAAHIATIGRRPAPMRDNYVCVVRAHPVYIAVSGLRRIGVLVLTPRDDDLLIDNVAVDPAFHGRHVGSALMRHAERVARGLGYTALVLYTHARMRANRIRYRRLGYRETGRLHEHGFDRVYMRKTLHR